MFVEERRDPWIERGIDAVLEESDEFDEVKARFF
jgi:hypothetical protein